MKKTVIILVDKETSTVTVSTLGDDPIIIDLGDDDTLEIGGGTKNPKPKNG